MSEENIKIEGGDGVVQNLDLDKYTDLLLKLDEVGIAASSGSACTSGSLTPSHVLRTMGIPFTFIQGSVRFSLSRYNTQKDIDYIIKNFPPIIKQLREISPYGKK